MNIKLITCVCIAAIFLFNSCKKEDNDLKFPFTLENGQIEKLSDVQLFTNQQELKDAAKTSKFIEGSAMFNLHLQDNRLGSLTFLSSDSAYFNYPDNKYSVENKDGMLFFYSTLLYSDEALANTTSLVKYWESHINTAQGIMAREIRVAKGSLESLEFSCMAYKLSKNRYDTNGKVISSSQEAGVLYNEFNEAFVSSLGGHDTLAVQKFVIKMKVH